MNRRRFAAAALAAALLALPLTACAQPFAGLPSSAPLTDEAARSGAAGPLLDGATEKETASDEAGPSIISSGDVSIEVADPVAAADAVAAMAAELGGSVESQTTNRGADGTTAGASLLVRVPAEKFDAALLRLESVGTVTSESRSAEDVTAVHADQQARVKALQESVDRLSELMRGAATTSELIEAETALSQRQQELDGLKAQLKALEDQIDQASIWVTLSTHSALPGGPANFWEGLLAGLASLGAAASGGLVLLGILLPWLVLGAVIALAIVIPLRIRGKRRRQQLAAEAAIPPPATESVVEQHPLY